jgi:hypothetical protein
VAGASHVRVPVVAAVTILLVLKRMWKGRGGHFPVILGSPSSADAVSESLIASNRNKKLQPGNCLTQ